MTPSVFLILSGTYVGPELVSEFGRLPPCFLPNGTRRLFEEQIAFGRTLSPQIVVLLPETFDEAAPDRAKLGAGDVRVVRIDERMSISECLAHALATIAHDGRLFILFGDTLVDYDAQSGPDSFVAGATRHLAKWADFTQDGGAITFHESVQAGGETREVVAGFFDFADAALLRRSAETHREFIAVLNAYAATRTLRPVPTARWLDFGHLHTYYWSRRTELTARAFNQVTGDGLTIRKTGTPGHKIFAEASWFQNLPPRFRPFVPHLIDVSRSPEIAYELEYLHLPVLSELYCFANLPSGLWFNIIASCKRFLELCQDTRPDTFEIPPDFHARFFDDMLVQKTLGRLETFARSARLSLDEPWSLDSAPMPSLSRVVQNLLRLVRPSAAGDICMWHGDFHFANIFFDFRSQRVRVVDPRGMLSDGTPTMFGDARYDIGKLTHSVVGLYDDLIAGRYALAYDGRHALGLELHVDAERDALIRDYRELRIGSYRCGDAETTAMAALLFLSMLPIHDDDRQLQFALLANGLRLARDAEALA